jgi:hypothetical protein
MGREFKKIVNSGVDLDKCKPNIKAFINYVTGDFETQMNLYKGVINVDSIKLENLVSTKYLHLVRGTYLRDTTSFVEEIVKRVDEFKGNEPALRVMIEFYALYFVIVVKLVDVYLGSISAFSVTDPNYMNYKFDDIGIDDSVLRYYKLIEDIKQKTINEWKVAKISDTEERYLSSAIKRILLMFGY